jgi:hypothetical protein
MGLRELLKAVCIQSSNHRISWTVAVISRVKEGEGKGLGGGKTLMWMQVPDNDEDDEEETLDEEEAITKEPAPPP